jgi:hypothetical protein
MFLYADVQKLFVSKGVTKQSREFERTHEENWNKNYKCSMAVMLRSQLTLQMGLQNRFSLFYGSHLIMLLPKCLSREQGSVN